MATALSDSFFLAGYGLSPPGKYEASLESRAEFKQERKNQNENEKQTIKNKPGQNIRQSRHIK